MIEVLGYVAGPLTGASVLAMLFFVAKLCNLKGLISLWSEHLEMRATARRMRSAGASDKQIARYLADHSITRAGRSP